jgi:glycosyltransferase involved in cell wall biosynthesis
MTNPAISIIITPHGNSTISPECVAAARKSAGGDAEIILLDDASVPDIQALGQSVGAKVVHSGKVKRTAMARNIGARAATGDILLFLDSDVVLGQGTIPEILRTFQETGCDALVGNYDRPSRKTPLFSQYQDLFTCWHHLQSVKNGDRIAWFWTPIGAVRRDRFNEIGSFHEDSHAEDIEFGFDLTARGGGILMRTDITGRHEHGRTILSYIASVFKESAGLSDLHLRKNRSLRLKTPFGGWRNIVTLPNSYFMFITLLIGTFFPSLWWFNGVSAGAALIHSFVINRQLYKFVTQGRPFFFRGLLFGAFVFYNHVGTNLIVGVAIKYGALRHLLRRR